MWMGFSVCLPCGVWSSNVPVPRALVVLKCFLAAVEVCAFCLGRSGKGREKGKRGMNLGLLSIVLLILVWFLISRSEKRNWGLTIVFLIFWMGYICLSITRLDLGLTFFFLLFPGLFVLFPWPLLCYFVFLGSFWEYRFIAIFFPSLFKKINFLQLWFKKKLTYACFCLTNSVK